MNKRRKLLQNFTMFAGDIKSPASIDVDPYVWKANCRLAISFNQDVDAGDVKILVNSREYPVPTLKAGAIYKLDYIERARKIGYTSATPGKLTIYVLDQWNRHFKVAGNT